MSTINNENSTATATVTTPTIVIHGGAWAIPDSLVDASCNGVQNAAIAGYRVLTCEDDGGSSSSSLALDAVQAAVRVLEDDPAFDAGVDKYAEALEIECPCMGPSKDVNWDGEGAYMKCLMDGIQNLRGKNAPLYTEMFHL